MRHKWARELDYRLQKNLWCFTDNRIAVSFEYESHDKDGQWWRSHLYDGLQYLPAIRLRVVLEGASSKRAHRSDAGSARATLTLERAAV